MTVLLSMNLLSWSQNSINYSIPSTGVIEVDSVKLPVELIRKANIKLIEAEADKAIKNQLLKIVDTYKSENNALNSFINKQNKILISVTNDNNKIKEENDKLMKKLNVSLIGNCGLLIALGLIILL